MEIKNVSFEEQIVEQSGHRVSVTKLSGDVRSAEEEAIIRETPITLYINGQELVTLMCTPTKETYLVAGFLFLEGIISRAEDVLLMRVCAEENVADVRLAKDFTVDRPPRTLTSGCGGGTTFAADPNLAPVESRARLSPEQVTSSMVALLQRAGIYRQTGGVHAAALGDGDNLLVVAEDVGRHNTLDKIAGECFLLGIPTGGRILFTTGRISSEMLVKSAKMGIPIVVSRSSPTDLAVRLGQDLNITVVGYVRGRSCTVYSHDWRIS